MSNEVAPLRASKFLERALLFTIAMHGLAMLSMAVILLPGMLGGTSTTDAQRIAYIANNAALWRLGWLPWQLTALSDLILAVALVRTNWIPKVPAVIVLLLTITAMSIEQPQEFWWVTKAIELARQAVKTSSPQVYLMPESYAFIQVAAWAALFYTLAALFWTWCFAAAGTWCSWLTLLSIPTWLDLLFVSLAPLMPPGWKPAPNIVSGGNALGFVMMMLWLVIVLEMVLRRSRPITKWGREALFRHPIGGLAGWCLDLVANSRAARYALEWMPSVAFASDIRDVIYINYIVPADRLEPLVPQGLKLERIGKEQEFAMFTFLTYRHGHFGPVMLRALSQCLPSPVQSNWRIHVIEPKSGRRAVTFITTAIDDTACALAARLLSDGVAMHVPRRATLTRQENGVIALELEPGTGTAPDARADLVPGSPADCAHAWQKCFSSYEDMLSYCVPQDHALSSLPWYRKFCRHEIDLGIRLDACEPLTGTVQSKTAASIARDAQAFCFRVARVNFLLAGTRYDAD